MTKNGVLKLISFILVFSFVLLLVFYTYVLGLRGYISVENDSLIEENVAISDLVDTSEISEISLDVPLVSQLPELPTGCEITATTMLFNYEGIDVDKVTLAYEMPYDNEDPDLGYVGNPFFYSGWTIYPPALEELFEEYLGSFKDLTGCDINDLVYYLANEKPIVVWVSDFHYLEVHAITLTGFDEDNLYYNDPLSGEEDVKISKTNFINSWAKQDYRAVSY